MIDAGNCLTNLLRCAVVPLDIVRNGQNLTVRLDDLLAGAIEDQYRPAADAQELRDLVMALLRVVTWRKETYARQAELRRELIVDFCQVGGRARNGDVPGHNIAVIKANVVDRMRHFVAADANLAILLNDGIKGGGDQRDRVHNWQAGDVNLRPLVNGLVSLVNPDVDLLLEDL